jgi:ABC-type sugar transport system ATPase subunit
VKNGIAYLPEDRQQEGLFLPFSIASNISYSTPRMIARRGWINFAKERDIAVESCKRFDVKMRKVQQIVKELSGGNQQKVVLAKWLLTGPNIFILDEPTRGIDVGAKEEVYRIINQLARSGKAIIMISSELPEIIALSDKILVMKEGRITGRFEKAEANEASIMHAATAVAKIEVQNG